MLMEQEVPVTIHRGKPGELWDEAQSETAQESSGINETVDGLLSGFRKSEPGMMLQRGAHKMKEYVKNNPGQALLVSLGAGALFGLLLKKRR